MASEDDEKSKEFTSLVETLLVEAENKSFSKTHTAKGKKGKEKLKANTDLIFKRTHQRIREREFFIKVRQENISISKTVYGLNSYVEIKEQNHLDQSVCNYLGTCKRGCPISQERNKGRSQLSKENFSCWKEVRRLSKISEETRHDSDSERMNHGSVYIITRISYASQNFQENFEISGSDLQESTSAQTFDEVYSCVNTRKRKVRRSGVYQETYEREDTKDYSSPENNLEAASVVKASAEISPTLRKAKPIIASIERIDASQTEKILERVRKRRPQNPSGEYLDETNVTTDNFHPLKNSTMILPKEKKIESENSPTKLKLSAEFEKSPKKRKLSLEQLSTTKSLHIDYLKKMYAVACPDIS